MEDIVETGKRYKGFGVTIREYGKHIGISQARWYMLVKKVKEKGDTQKRARGGKNVNALTEEEKEKVVTYALKHPQYYLRYKNRDIYQLTFIDVYSRYVGLWVPLRNMESRTVSRIFEGLIVQKQDELQSRPGLQTDNGSCFIGTEFRGVVSKYLVEHTTIHPSTPTENVIIEQWHRTFKELLYEQEESEDCETLVKNTQAACEYYNYKRYHSSLKYMTPYEWYRGEPERIESERKMKLQEARILRCAINCNKGKDSLFLIA